MECVDEVGGSRLERVRVTKEAIVAATAISAELVRVDDSLDFTERAAIAGFLAAYAGNTLVSYTTDLRLFVESPC